MALNIPHSKHDYITAVAAVFRLDSLADRGHALKILNVYTIGETDSQTLVLPINFEVPWFATRSEIPFCAPISTANYKINLSNIC